MARPRSHQVHTLRAWIELADDYPDTNVAVSKEHSLCCRGRIFWLVPNLESIPTVQITGVAAKMAVLENSNGW